MDRPRTARFGSAEALKALALAGVLLVASAGPALPQDRGVNRDVATLLSLVGTAGPVALGVAIGSAWPVVGAMIAGPSIGYFYGGVAEDGTVGILLRGAVLGGSVALAVAVCGDCSIFDDDARTDAAFGILLAGFVATAVLDLRDIFRVGGVIERRERERATMGLLRVPGVGLGFGVSISR